MVATSGREDSVEQDGVAAVMLDLRDLTFIDSSGLHVFLQAKN
jgi:anti-anti-sigma regulatory factor